MEQSFDDKAMARLARGYVELWTKAARTRDDADKKRAFEAFNEMKTLYHKEQSGHDSQIGGEHGPEIKGLAYQIYGLASAHPAFNQTSGVINNAVDHLLAMATVLSMRVRLDGTNVRVNEFMSQLKDAIKETPDRLDSDILKDTRDLIGHFLKDLS